jgi:hypothetical protein
MKVADRDSDGVGNPYNVDGHVTAEVSVVAKLAPPPFTPTLNRLVVEQGASRLRALGDSN